MGFRFTVTRGIVSALNRPNPFGRDPRQPGGFIQTDAAINPGNSGGALVNARGELVGINTFLVSATGGFSGMGFAIPSQLAEHVASSLARTGKVVHPRVGIGISDVTPENAQFFNLKDASGALVTQVEPDSPASRAGLKVGDVVKKMNDTEITDATQFQVAVQEQQVGNKVNMEIVRDGKQINVPVTLEAMDAKKEMASGDSKEHGKARWGIGLADLTSDARNELQLPSDVHGALVAQVQPGSPADNAGLTRGDVIIQVNRTDVKSAADVKQSLGNIPAGKDALLLVYSRGGNSFRVLHPEQQPS
jgi:serine protease Do